MYVFPYVCFQLVIGRNVIFFKFSDKQIFFFFSESVPEHIQKLLFPQSKTNYYFRIKLPVPRNRDYVNRFSLLSLECDNPTAASLYLLCIQ